MKPYRDTIICFLLIAIGCGLLYANALFGDFVYDDAHFVVENPFIRSFSNVGTYFTLKSAVSPTGHGIWRPLRTFSFAGDYFFWGLKPFGFHLTNILLHIINAFLLFVVTRRLYDDGLFAGVGLSRNTVSFLVAWLWCAHPVHVEAVSWISSRGDLLFSMWYLISFLIYLRATRQGHVRTPLFLLSQCCFMLALLSKESAITLPAILFLYDHSVRYRVVRESKPKLARYLPYVLLAAGYMMVRYSVLGSVAQAEWWGGNLYHTAVTMIRVLARYVRLLLCPFGLHTLYDVRVSSSFFELGVFFSAAVLICIGIALKYMHRCFRGTVFAVAWFGIHLLPVSQIVPISGGLMNEHFLYLASFGFCIILVRFVALIIERVKKLEKVRAFIIIGLCMSITLWYGDIVIAHNHVWKNERTFWTHEARFSPYRAKVRVGLATVYHAEKQYERAIEEYTHALLITPDDPDIYINMADIYNTLGLYDQAMDACQWALTFDCECPQVYASLAMTLDNMGRYSEAITLYYCALEMYPYSAGFMYGLGLAYDHANALDKARMAYELALKLKPEFPEAHNNMGIVCHKLGQVDAACSHWRQALDLDPTVFSAADNLKKYGK